MMVVATLKFKAKCTGKTYRVHLFSWFDNKLKSYMLMLCVIYLQTPGGAAVDPRWPRHLQRVSLGHRPRLRRRLGRPLHRLPQIPPPIGCVSAG